MGPNWLRHTSKNINGVPRAGPDVGGQGRFSETKYYGLELYFPE